MKRPGYNRASVVISIAANSGLRTVAGISPMPTLTREVAASIVAAEVSAPAQKLSSHNQISSNPPASACLAKLTSVSGGLVG
jgi:hypothetical protein